MSENLWFPDVFKGYRNVTCLKWDEQYSKWIFVCITFEKASRNDTINQECF